MKVNVLRKLTALIIVIGCILIDKPLTVSDVPSNAEDGENTTNQYNSESENVTGTIDTQNDNENDGQQVVQPMTEEMQKMADIVNTLDSAFLAELAEDQVDLTNMYVRSPLDGTDTPDFSSAAYKAENPYWVDGFGDQCTAYVWGRAYEVFGMELPLLHDAIYWWYDNEKYGFYEFGISPKANSIAVWSNPRHGHVAYVEEVTASTITFTEANWDAPGYNGEKTLSYDEFQYRNDGVLMGYIYLEKY